MEQKIGRFAAYIPDDDTFNILLKIISLSALKRGDLLDSPMHKIHRFFYKMKNTYPKIFEDVFFNHDPDFPYSGDVSEAIIRLQESGFVTRPNPSLNRYKIDVDLKDERPDPSSRDYENIKAIAEKFKEKFLVTEDSHDSNEPAC